MKTGVFFSELKRRNVLRAGALYIAAAWALAQGAAQLLPVYDVSAWVMRWFIAALIIGFPFWIAFAWFYEITPSGLKRESEIAPSESITAHTGRKLDFAIIGILAVAVVLLVTNQFVLHRDATSAANTADAKTLAVELAKLPQKSVAVLPLANESGNPKQQYFVDGMSEELISDLTQLNGLKVIGKYSSFKFRDTKDSPAQIGAALGVAHLIQGSVFQQGDQIQVTVSMIRAKDGSSVWSHSYDEPLKDVFAIQKKIGHAVAAALQVKLLGQTFAVDDKPPSGNVEAYQLMLQGRAIYQHNTEAEIRRGIALYQQALKLDPNYAYAWGRLSNAWVHMGLNYLTGDARQQAYAQARVAADKQQGLSPNALFTRLIQGQLLADIANDPVGALAEYKRAYALAPNDGTVMNFMASGLANSGQLQPAADLYRKVIATDPLRPDFYADLAQVLLAQGQLDAAEHAFHKALALQPDYPYLYSYLAEIDILRGDAAAAVRNANQIKDDRETKAWTLSAAAQIAPDRKKADAALHAYIAKYGKTQPYNVADLYAVRKQPDEMFEWLQRAWTQHDPNFTELLYDPFITQVYQHDPRFAALCKQAGLPVPGRPLPAVASTSGR